MLPANTPLLSRNELISTSGHRGVNTDGGSRPDPLMLLTLLIVGSSPTAMNMITLCRLAGRWVQEMAVVMAWQYMLAAASMSTFTIGALLLLSGGGDL